jgi:hypothetical protein
VPHSSRRGRPSPRCKQLQQQQQVEVMVLGVVQRLQDAADPVVLLMPCCWLRACPS